MLQMLSERNAMDEMRMSVVQEQKQQELAARREAHEEKVAVAQVLLSLWWLAGMSIVTLLACSNDNPNKDMNNPKDVAQDPKKACQITPTNPN